MATSSQDFAVIMAPADQTWWWYWGQTAEQVGQLLTQNKAMLTDISAYIDVDGTLKFAVIMAPADQTWWWYWGQTAEQVGQLLTQNKARLIAVRPYPLCYFISSKLDGNVIDIVEASTSPGAPLDAWPQKSSGTDNQLWEFIADPAGSGYCFISSKLSGNVIDIQGASSAPGTRLDAYPRKFSGYDSQLWTVAGGSFPSVVETVPERPQGNSGYFNYVLANGSSCSNLTGVKATIYFTEDLVWESSDQPNHPGFSIQLNAETNSSQPLDWLQFMVHIGDDQGLWPWINIWDPSGGEPQALWIQTVNNPVATMPQAARIPAGYSIIIALQYDNDNEGRVTGATWTVLDGSGNPVGSSPVTYALSNTEGGGVPPADLSPIASFQVTFGGAMDAAYATFSSGAGVIIYEADQAMTVDWWPACIGYTGGTAESSNIGYGALGATPAVLFSQPFGVVADSAQTREANPNGRKSPPH